MHLNFLSEIPSPSFLIETRLMLRVAALRRAGRVRPFDALVSPFLSIDEPLTLLWRGEVNLFLAYHVYLRVKFLPFFDLGYNLIPYDL